MRVRLLRDEFQDGFVIERALLGFAEPVSALGLQPCQIVRVDRVAGVGRHLEGNARFGFAIQIACDGQMFALLKRAQCRAGLRAGHAVERTGGNALSSECELRFKHILRAPSGGDGFDFRRIGFRGHGRGRRIGDRRNRLRNKVGEDRRRFGRGLVGQWRTR